jgi:hypothetical protein
MSFDSTLMRTLRVTAVRAVLVAACLQALASAPLRAGMVPDPACEQDCHDQYIFCLDYYCDPRGTCTCWTDYQSCVSFCPLICVEPKSVKDFTTTTLLSAQQTGSTCVEDYPHAGKGCWYSEYFAKYQVTNYRDTTHCDGTTTRTVLSSSTSSNYCVRRQNPTVCNSCSPYLLYNGVNHCGF